MFKPVFQNLLLRLIILSFLSMPAFSQEAGVSYLDITASTIVTGKTLSNIEQNAIKMLIEEVEKRTQLRLNSISKWPKKSGPLIVIGRQNVLRQFESKIKIPENRTGAEGYQLQVQRLAGRDIIIVSGNDDRGLLFGVGHLLRIMRMSYRNILIPEKTDIKTAPEYPLRGHQIGYRPKPNSYDAWTPKMMEQYIRDLIVFGTNAIELIPPRSDDKPTSPHFPIPQMDMMIKMSQICKDYGLDVWVWYPALDDDYGNPETIKSAIREWGSVLKQLPRLDAILVPCGDPGHTPPELLMPMLEKQAVQLKQYHPDVKWWVGPQGFGEKELGKFHEIISGKPGWLTGMVYGPGIRMSLPEFSNWLPDGYPIRHYPDITHSNYCQYPVADWDPAFNLIESREVSNPRPVDFAAIFKRLQPYTIGFITYSEGCHDDVNKIIWSRLGWNSDVGVMEVLLEYSRYFIGVEYEHDFAQLILSLEKNWQGPAITNNFINTTYLQLKAIENKSSERVKNNWRFQLALWRSTLDFFIKRRLRYETSLEESVLAILDQAPQLGSLNAIEQSKRILNEAVENPITNQLRDELFKLGDELFTSIGLQLYAKHSPSRADGAVLSRVDMPLNNRFWLNAQFEEIMALTDEKNRLKEINAIRNRTNPGPGGFYDNLGDPSSQPHLVKNKGFELDPIVSRIPISGVDYLNALTLPVLRAKASDFPLSWLTCGIGLYDEPITLEYHHLDPVARYRVKVAYGSKPIKLVADDKFIVHDFLEDTHNILSFVVPGNATKDGFLKLSWYKPFGLGQYQMRHLVYEVWLVKE
ncbi:alpha-glucuronidase family glycosyl hydrolase [Fulvivirgaceae bacterium BMA12]|uniref:Alpha-glucuronidase family glycosyl hydrolase n=1 Tax=Agaribacillus aureus TaxID=3051825 RepID=A0ABT8L3M6_9BACT|nr:alpha-glucuronidase family glycosyl hydrolase [Fulvivirgaceae bacterium BMA12]